MLRVFRVANYKSIKDPLELNMARPKRFQADSTEQWDAAISSIAAIYGANASGKTNIVDAFAYFRSAVRRSYRTWEAGSGTGCTPFLLDTQSVDLPSEFEIEFVANDGFIYQYGAAISSNRIDSEWLYQYRTNSRSMIYERNVDAPGLKFGNSFRGERKMLEDMAEERENALILSVGGQLKHKMLRPVYDWILGSIRVFAAHSHSNGISPAARSIRNSEAHRMQVARMLGAADFGVTDIEAFEAELDDKMRDQLSAIMRIVEPDADEKTEDAIRERSSLTLQLSHRGTDSPVILPFDEESDGTKAMVAYSLVFLHALMQRSVLVIDELDSSLHPLLVAQIVRIFSDPTINKRQTQLIFTTHDVSLLGGNNGTSDLLEADQTWLVEKSLEGSTQLSSLVEYKIRRDENTFRGYMTGRYGGIPGSNLVNVMRSIVDEWGDK